MNKESNKKNWRSLAERDDDTLGAVVDPYGDQPAAINRRRFLEVAGFTFSLAAISGCGRTPTETALPFAVQPEGVIPGRSMSYASTCFGCTAACGILATVRDGRPIKMEGMPEHPLSVGGLCAVGQALPLGLYDSHRLAGPLQNNKEATWDVVDKAIIKQLGEIEQNEGAVRFVTATITSPTLKAEIDRFLKKFKDAKHITFDAVSQSAILDAHQKTDAARVLPHYKLENAKVIVSFGADFLGTWISPVEFTAAWRKGRVPTKENRKMSYHAHFEGRMSLTGSNADRRYQLAPDEFGVVLSQLSAKIAERAKAAIPSGTLSTSTIAEKEIEDLVHRLWSNRGKSIVLCDSQDVNIQLLVNFINHTLGNYGKTLDIQSPSKQRQSNDSDVADLIEELNAGKVAALFVAGTDLTHNLPQRESLIAAIKKIPLIVSFAERVDDFSSLSNFICPDHHPLESWLDAQPTAELVSLSQPMLQPLKNTRSILESLARFSGRKESAYNILRGSWKSFTKSWDQAVQTGFVKIKAKPTPVGKFQSDAIKFVSKSPASDGYLLSLHTNIAIPDSRHAQNPWLQELSDPITKAAWDNYVSISQAAAKKLNLTDGDMVSVSSDALKYSIELPVLIQPGQHDRVISIALAYGVKGTDRFANIGPQWFEGKPTVNKGELVGKNAAGFIQLREGALQYDVENITLKKTGERRPLAMTQEHHSLTLPKNVAPRGGEVRDAVQTITLVDFIKDPKSGSVHQHFDLSKQLWAEDHPKNVHHWGMALDLNVCTGCSACVIACQSENNVPLVGKDEIVRQREMQWMRIDRYYSGENDDLSVSHQPMMCHHCDNAPCETVCPVLATVHSTEGLNEQAYNRCVGTRYCANNCPYKVRRFNWFEYPRDDTLQNLALNPDVTVRSRGVMEKCSMCVQRIEEGKIEARRRAQPVADDDIQTACQQSCPAQAIIFGDMNDTESRIYQAIKDPRNYRVLEELNVRPSVSYQRVVKNRDDQHHSEAKHD